VALRLALVCIAALLALAGCTVDVPGRGPGGPASPGPPSSSGGLEGKLSNNGLALDPAVLALLDPAPLGRWDEGGAAIADPGRLASILAAPGGIDHVEYLAACALDRDRSLVVDAPDGARRFEGLFGLAESWVTAPCDDGCQNWLSSCLLAHANAWGQQVTISLRGAHPGLVWDDDIAGEFVLQEAAFYGNVFAVADSEAATPLYACTGRALLSFDDDAASPSSSDYLRERICGAGSSQCGLVHTGPCHFPIPEGSACVDDAGPDGFFSRCKGGAGDPVYPEAITIYLAE
jgi:hypothetical protein